MRGLTQTTREPAGSRKLIYGQVRVGGQIVFIANSGQTNEYLHLVIVYASHEIESFEEFWFNDNKVYENNAVTSDWSDYVTIAKFDGTQTTADSTLTSVSNQWTSNHILNGMAYAHVRLKWDQDKFPQGVPNVTAVIKGKKVLRPERQQPKRNRFIDMDVQPKPCAVCTRLFSRYQIRPWRGPYTDRQYGADCGG